MAINNEISTTTVAETEITSTNIIDIAAEIAAEKFGEDATPQRNDAPAFPYNEKLREAMVQQNLKSLQEFFEEFKARTFEMTEADRAANEKLQANPKRRQNDVRVARMRMEAIKRRQMYGRLKKLVEQAEIKAEAGYKNIVDPRELAEFVRHGVLTNAWFEKLSNADILDVLHGQTPHNERYARYGMQNFVIPGHAVIDMHANHFVISTEKGDFPISGETLLRLIILGKKDQIVPWNQDCVFPTKNTYPSIDGYSFVVENYKIPWKDGKGGISGDKIRISLSNKLYRVFVECIIRGQYLNAKPEILAKFDKYSLLTNIVMNLFEDPAFVPQHKYHVEALWLHMVVLTQKNEREEIEWKTPRASQKYLGNNKYLAIRGYDPVDGLNQLYDYDFFLKGFKAMEIRDQEYANQRAQAQQQQRDADGNQQQQSTRGYRSSMPSQRLEEEEDYSEYAAAFSAEIPSAEDYTL